MKYVYYVRFDEIVKFKREDWPQHEFNASGVNVVAGTMEQALQAARMKYPRVGIKGVERTCHVGGLPVLIAE
jgi:hypothetical protein